MKILAIIWIIVSMIGVVIALGAMLLQVSSGHYYWAVFDLGLIILNTYYLTMALDNYDEVSTYY